MNTSTHIDKVLAELYYQRGRLSVQAYELDRTASQIRKALIAVSSSLVGVVCYTLFYAVTNNI